MLLFTSTKNRYICRPTTIMICFFIIIKLRWWWRYCRRITNYITQFLLDDSEGESQDRWYEIKISEKKQGGQMIECLIWKEI